MKIKAKVIESLKLILRVNGCKPLVEANIRIPLQRIDEPDELMVVVTGLKSKFI